MPTDEMIRVAELPVFDLSDYLHSDADVTGYLSQVLADGDTDALLRALGHVAKAKHGHRHGAGRAGAGKPLQGAGPRRETAFRHHPESVQGVGRPPASGVGRHYPIASPRVAPARRIPSPVGLASLLEGPHPEGGAMVYAN